MVILGGLKRYSLKVVFAFIFLIGLQIPNFLQQYEHRLDAHYLELQNHLHSYQLIADKFFDGNLQALIIKHRSSGVLAFQEEAVIIDKLRNRFYLLQYKKKSLQGSLIGKLYFLLGEVKSPLVLETQQNYVPEIVLNKNTILIGLSSALSLTLFLEFLFIVLGKMIGVFFIRKLN